MAQQDPRCVFAILSDPSTFGAGVPTKTHLESNIQKFNPRLMHDTGFAGRFHLLSVMVTIVFDTGQPNDELEHPPPPSFRMAPNSGFEMRFAIGFQHRWVPGVPTKTRLESRMKMF